MVQNSYSNRIMAISEIQQPTSIFSLSRVSLSLQSIPAVLIPLHQLTKNNNNNNTNNNNGNNNNNNNNDNRLQKNLPLFCCEKDSRIKIKTNDSNFNNKFAQIEKNLKLSSSSSSSSSSLLLPSIRIIGGYDAIKNSAPFIVSLQRGTYDTVGYNGKHGCSGSIITQNVILTAAHCLKTDNLTDIYAIAGLYKLHLNNSIDANSNYYNLNKTNEKLIRFNSKTKVIMSINNRNSNNTNNNNNNTEIQKKKVKFYIRHENFTAWNQSGPNDIALLFLYSSFQFNEKISNIILIKFNEQTSLNKLATLYGWGSTKLNGSKKDRANTLQMITTNLLTFKQCRELLPNNKRLHSTNICTASFNQPSIACHGDSGGPLVQQYIVDGHNITIQIGIVSWGFRICGWKSKPSIYTYTGAFYDWIWKTIEKFNSR